MWRQWSLSNAGWMHLPFPDTRWRSVLCLPCTGATAASPGCCYWPWKMQGWAKGFLLIMLWDTWVMKTHSYTDTAPNLMFWCLNLPGPPRTLHPLRLSLLPPFILWSHEQWIKYTVITKVRYRCTLTGVKEHWSRFKNKLNAVSILIYILRCWCECFFLFFF